MTTDPLAGPQLNDNWGCFAATRTKALALRYDNLPHILIDLDNAAVAPTKRKRTVSPAGGGARLADLRAQVSTLQAENERLAERLTYELEAFADRIAELEAHARKPWWRRAFGDAGDELTQTRARRRVREQLRSVLDADAAAPA